MYLLFDEKSRIVQIGLVREHKKKRRQLRRRFDDKRVVAHRQTVEGRLRGYPGEPLLVKDKSPTEVAANVALSTDEKIDRPRATAERAPKGALRICGGASQRRQNRKRLTQSAFNNIKYYMSTRNTFQPAPRRLVSESNRMARKPKPVAPTAEVHRISFLLEGTIVAQIDAAAKEIAEADPYHRVMTRTDALRALLIEGLQARAARSKKKT